MAYSLGHAAQETRMLRVPLATWTTTIDIAWHGNRLLRSLVALSLTPPYTFMLAKWRHKCYHSSSIVLLFSSGATLLSAVPDVSQPYIGGFVGMARILRRKSVETMTNPAPYDVYSCSLLSA